MERPELEDYRDAIASVHLDGVHVGYLATLVEPMRAGFLLRRQERVWLLLTLLDGTVNIQEDYAPWTYVRELPDGHITWSSLDGSDVDYEVRWLAEDERQREWPRCGIVEEVGIYMGRANGLVPLAAGADPTERWPVRHHQRVDDDRPDLRRIRRRYGLGCRIDQLLGRRRALANDALWVVLEWGPPMRLPEAWRLQQRQPGATADHRADALAEAREVTRAAYDLTADAWPQDRREDPAEVDRLGRMALQKLTLRYPHLEPASLRRAVSQAHYFLRDAETSTLVVVAASVSTVASSLLLRRWATGLVGRRG